MSNRRRGTSNQEESFRKLLKSKTDQIEELCRKTEAADEIISAVYERYGEEGRTNEPSVIAAKAYIDEFCKGN